MTVDDLIQAKKNQLSEQKILVSEQQLKEQAGEMLRVPRSLHKALSGPELSLIGPIMKGTPYKKTSKLTCDPGRIARTEQREGAKALMVATEETFFRGQQQFVGQVQAYAQVPVLLYDCIIEPYQIYSAAVLGADAVVLMAAVLDSETLQRFAALLHQLGLQAVVEVHTEQEGQTALESGISIVLINNLMLDGSGSLETTHQLLPMFPEGNPVISWGDVSTPADLTQLQAWGAAGACPEPCLLRALDAT